MRRIVFAGVPPLEVQDLAGPLEVFSQCSGYHIELASLERDGSVEINCGLRIQGGVYYQRVAGALDTFWLVGGPEAPSGVFPPGYLEWVRSTAGRARRVGASCLGTFVLAAAGVLNGKRTVTHWQWCDTLEQRYREIVVDRSAIFTKDGHVHTSAGISTGIDLALSFVEEDLGRARAQAIAEWLVLYVRRTGNQGQLSQLLQAQKSWTSRFDLLQEWVQEHAAESLNVEALARFCGMSQRHFARVFQEEKGITPARFVEEVRIEAAKRMLADSRAGLKEVALRCGFGSADSLRRSFRRVTGTTPAEFAEACRAERRESPSALCQPPLGTTALRGRRRQSA